MTSQPGEEKDMMRVQPCTALGYSTDNNLPRGPDPFPGGSKPKSGSNPRVGYRECLKNHAANIGGHVTDGCGEFMPSGEDGTLEALKCAACSCHRNFHRREHHGGECAAAVVHPLQLPSPSMSQHRGGGGHWSPMVNPVKTAAAFGGTDSSSEELNFNAYQSGGGGLAPAPPQFVARKRFRTKFTAAQKEKMLEFAEKLGWRIPRDDDTEVQKFCADNGVKRQVFKVWMHNNKSTSSSSSKKSNPQEF